ncbi:MAG: phosphotransferase [Gammaproteobacteria bacterium]|nr:phosphotransferase [Gammaproteobacteria bacterium]
MLPNVDDLREACLSHLPDLADHTFSEPPERLPGGNETSIFAISFDVPPHHPCSGPLIIRIFDNPASHFEQYRWEAATHDVLVRSGYPVPKVLVAARHAKIGAFVIMERLNGVMLGSQGLEMPAGVLHFPKIYRNLPATLADLHLELHRVDPLPLQQKLSTLEVAQEGFTPVGRINRIHELAPRKWSSAHRACEVLLTQLPTTTDARLCHGDFHPLNVMTEKNRITGVIDWSKICFADREYDLANAHLLLQASVLVLPGWVVPSINALKSRMAERFLEHYARCHDIDTDKLSFFRALRACEELVLAHEGFAPQMGEVGGWNMDFLDSALIQQTGISLTA